MEINNNIQETYCSFELSRLLKDKGLKVHCDRIFDLQEKNKIVSWKDLQVKKCIEYDKSYSYKAVEYLENDYFIENKNEDEGYFICNPPLSLAVECVRINFGIFIYSQQVFEF